MRRWRSHRFPMLKLLLKTHVCRLLQPQFSLNFTQKRLREATPEACQRTKRWNGPRAIKVLPGTVHRRCPILCPGRNHFNRDLQFRGVLLLYLSVYHRLQTHPSPKRCQSQDMRQIISWSIYGPETAYLSRKSHIPPVCTVPSNRESLKDTSGGVYRVVQD